jgi:hypothetical protein
MVPNAAHPILAIAPLRHTEPDNISIQSINWQQLEAGDGDDVGVVLDSLKTWGSTELIPLSMP